VFVGASPDDDARLTHHIHRVDVSRSQFVAKWFNARMRTPGVTFARERAGTLLGRWPVRTPAGFLPLPTAANILKAVDTDTICALSEEAGRLRLGLGSGGPRLRRHLAPDAVHYLVPDPATYYWPGSPNGRGGRIDWWHCHALLRMYNGEQVKNGVAVLPETFTALPSSVARRTQHRLVRVIRATERDTYLWGRDHEAECGPRTCGHIPEAAENPPPTSANPTR
jgi:hypothetical protein